jgi:hypothetical protein
MHQGMLLSLEWRGDIGGIRCKLVAKTLAQYPPNNEMPTRDASGKEGDRRRCHRVRRGIGVEFGANEKVREIVPADFLPVRPNRLETNAMGSKGVKGQAHCIRDRHTV